MVINPFIFLVSRSVAQSRGVSDQEATKLGLVGAMIKPPVLGIILASTVAGNEAPPPVRRGGGLFGAMLRRPLPPPRPQVLAIAAQPPGMISFHGMDRAQSEKYATWLGLTLQIDGPGNRVERQEPGIDKPWPADGILKLTMK